MPVSPLIFTALRIEARVIERALAGLSYEIQIIGIGAKRLPDLTGRKNGCVLMAGFCGGLDPSLKVADLVVDSTSELQISNLELFRCAKMHTADHVIATAAEKAELFRRTGAAAVEMENAAVCAAVRRAGLPFLGLRAVSDTAAQAIDPAVLKICDDIGRPRLFATAALILSRPGIVSQLRLLQSQSALAAAALGRGVRVVVEALNKGGS